MLFEVLLSKCKCSQKQEITPACIQIWAAGNAQREIPRSNLFMSTLNAASCQLLFVHFLFPVWEEQTYCMTKHMEPNTIMISCIYNCKQFKRPSVPFRCPNHKNCEWISSSFPTQEAAAPDLRQDFNFWYPLPLQYLSVGVECLFSQPHCVTALTSEWVLMIIAWYLCVYISAWHERDLNVSCSVKVVDVAR